MSDQNEHHEGGLFLLVLPLHFCHHYQFHFHLVRPLHAARTRAAGGSDGVGDGGWRRRWWVHRQIEQGAVWAPTEVQNENVAADKPETDAEDAIEKDVVVVVVAAVVAAGVVMVTVMRMRLRGAARSAATSRYVGMTTRTPSKQG